MPMIFATCFVIFPGLASVKMLARQGRGLPDWEKLDGILSEPQNLESLQAEAQSDVFGDACWDVSG